MRHPFACHLNTKRGQCIDLHTDIARLWIKTYHYCLFCASLFCSVSACSMISSVEGVSNRWYYGYFCFSITNCGYELTIERTVDVQVVLCSDTSDVIIRIYK